MVRYAAPEAEDSFNRHFEESASGPSLFTTLLTQMEDGTNVQVLVISTCRDLYSSWRRENPSKTIRIPRWARLLQRHARMKDLLTFIHHPNSKNPSKGFLYQPVDWMPDGPLVMEKGVRFSSENFHPVSTGQEFLTELLKIFATPARKRYTFAALTTTLRYQSRLLPSDWWTRKAMEGAVLHRDCPEGAPLRMFAAPNPEEGLVHCGQIAPFIPEEYLATLEEDGITTTQQLVDLAPDKWPVTLFYHVRRSYAVRYHGVPKRAGEPDSDDESSGDDISVGRSAEDNSSQEKESDYQPSEDCYDSDDSYDSDSDEFSEDELADIAASRANADEEKAGEDVKGAEAYNSTAALPGFLRRWKVSGSCFICKAQFPRALLCSLYYRMPDIAQRSKGKGTPKPLVCYCCV